jgi:sporulation protein YqfC
MKRDKGFLSGITQATNLETEPLPRIPLVEIYDQKRVIIENHRGVAGYGGCEVRVNMRYGVLTVCGENLQLARMNKDQLVITGKICGVQLRGRG